MTVTVRLFAILRERAGTDQVRLEVPSGASVASCAERVGERIPAIRELLPRVAFAVNRTYVKADATLSDGDELALIPPVSGG